MGLGSFCCEGRVLKREKRSMRKRAPRIRRAIRKNLDRVERRKELRPSMFGQGTWCCMEVRQKSNRCEENTRQAISSAQFPGDEAIGVAEEAEGRSQDANPSHNLRAYR